MVCFVLLPHGKNSLQYMRFVCIYLLNFIFLGQNGHDYSFGICCEVCL
jgi:hypothetical protein